MDIKNFSSREELEKHITERFGKTVEKKNEKIVGTKKELSFLGLSHGATVWGIPVFEKDFYEKTESINIKRGDRFPSKINGEIIS